MDALERSTEFVNKHPETFTENKNWWIAEIGLLILAVQSEQLETDTQRTLKIIGQAKA